MGHVTRASEFAVPGNRAEGRRRDAGSCKLGRKEGRKEKEMKRGKFEKILEGSAVGGITCLITH